MSTTASLSTNSINIDARLNDITPRLPSASTHTDAPFLSPSRRSTLIRHYASLQEHADHKFDSETLGDDGAPTPRQEGRREGFDWVIGPAYEDVRPKYSRSPLPPAQLDPQTPPTIDKLLRQPLNEDADTAHNARLAHNEALEFQPRTARSSCSSTAPTTLLRHDTRRSSIIDFARGIAKHVPDMITLIASEPVEQHQNERTRRDSKDRSSSGCGNGNKIDRKISFMLPPVLKQKQEKIPKSTLFAEDVKENPTTKQPCTQSPVKGSLRDRRKVNLDLSTPPTEIPDQPTHKRSSTMQIDSITPSRPRSPKTPWIRNEPLKWEHETGPYTAPIMEEDYIGQVAFGEDTATAGILPGNDIIKSSQSPRFERPPIKVRDRCHTSRPRFKRDRSGQSGTSQSELARTPDSSWTPDDSKSMQEKQARTNVELQQLGQASKNNRSGRWRWGRSTTRSSDEAMQASSTEVSTRRFSVNPFKRAGRIADQTDRDKEWKKTQSNSCRPWWLGKQAVTPAPDAGSSTYSHMAAPPLFVPPALQRVPTPTMPDANGEVKGQLADFFFDHGAGIVGRKAKSSPGGHWDSDALLMSYLSPDRVHEDSTEEEGPGGPIDSNHSARNFTVDRNPGVGTPGLVTTPGGYLDQVPGPKTPSPEPLDVWFRVPQHDSIDDGQLTALALREMEEKRLFEWIVPEHLPTSPLCPAHVKYGSSYSKGFCYWHSKNKTAQGRPGTERTSAYVVERSGEEKERKGKRRLQSLSSP